MMKFNKILLIIIAFLSCEVSFADGIEFEKDYSSAIKKAKEMGKMVMIDFYTEWCIPCKQMEEHLFRHKRVESYLKKNFISIRIDAEKGEGVELFKKYNIKGFPTLIFLNSEGVEERRLKGITLNVNYFLEVLRVVTNNATDIEKIFEKYNNAKGSAKLTQAQKILTIGPAHYSLMKGAEQIALKERVEGLSKEYFKHKPIEKMLNQDDFEIISSFYDGASSESPQVQFIYDNYNKFKKFVPEEDLATYVVQVNNKSIQNYSRRGDLLWKKFVNNIDRELASAYTFLGEKRAKESMNLVANINMALYVDKNISRYIRLREKYSTLQKEIGKRPQGDYFYAAQILYTYGKDNISKENILKGVNWLNLNIKEGFNITASYMMMGDFYSLMAGGEALAIYNYNRCVSESRKSGENVYKYYKGVATKKIAAIVSKINIRKNSTQTKSNK